MVNLNGKLYNYTNKKFEITLNEKKLIINPCEKKITMISTPVQNGLFKKKIPLFITKRKIIGVFPKAQCKGKYYIVDKQIFSVNRNRTDFLTPHFENEIFKGFFYNPVKNFNGKIKLCKLVHKKLLKLQLGLGVKGSSKVLEYLILDYIETKR